MATITTPAQLTPAPALELVGNQLMVNHLPALEVVFMETVPLVVIATEAGAFVVILEEFESATAADPRAG